MKRKMTKTRIFACMAVLSLSASIPSLAQTGTPINSLPAVISESGDYYIADDLTSALGAGNILVSVSSGITVNLDLNGKTIKSTAACDNIIFNAGNLTILDSSFDHTGTIDGTTKKSTEGRGIRSTGTLTVTGGSIINCNANGGGGICNFGGTLTIDGEYVVIQNCVASGNPRTGGGVYNTENGTFYFKNGTISGCKSTGTNGGGVANLSGSTFVMSGGTITGCTTGYNGAGVWNGGQMTMSGGTITSCTATANGGGVYNNGQMTMSGGSVTYSKTSTSGGGIASMSQTATLTIDPLDKEDILIDNNKASTYGGGIYVENGTMIFRNGTVTNNTAAQIGAGIGLMGATAVISGGYIAYNNADHCGGGIHSGQSSHSDIGDPDGNNEKLIIEHNKVTKGEASTTGTGGDGGGGICVGYAGSSNIMNLHACTIRYNESNLYGGGIFIRAVESVTDNNIEINAGLILENNAADGGGFYTNGQIKVSGGVFSKNTATKRGGGIYLGGNGKFTMTGGLIDGNKAATNGGGVWAGTTGSGSGSTVTISGGTFSNNEANQGGGFFANGKITLSDSNITGNSANNGGGFYVNGGTTTINGGVTLSGNSADMGGAAYLKGTTNLLGQDTNISGNDARLGGALYFESGKATVTAGLIKSNTASENGGAIYAQAGTLDINGSDIGYNTAESYGGGIYNAGSKITMTNGVIDWNSAVDGAGIYNIYNVTPSISLLAGEISHNIASGNGGGIFSNAGTIDFKKETNAVNVGYVMDNIAANGGGIYLTGTAKMNFTEGLISGNRAVSSDPIYTAYQSPSGIKGVGGGVYLGGGTSAANLVKLTFGETKIGIYQNFADNCADDLFADAKNTSTNIPTVNEVKLIGYAGKADGWYADYVVGDTNYDKGLFADGEGRRYRSDPETALKYTGSSDQNKKYVCLSLGIKPVKLTIRKSGLKTGESAIFSLTNPEAFNSREVVLTGISDDGAEVSATFGKIEAGTWTISETDWSWTYNPVASQEVVIDADDVEVSFINAKKTDIPANGEAIKNNVFSTNP